MKIVKQTDKHNQFNIENMTIARVLAIINSLEYCKEKGLLSNAGTALLEALNSQIDKLTLNNYS